MSLLWVWVEALRESGVIELAKDEARHVVSRRLRVGDDLIAFDAKGRTASARVESLDRKAVQIEVAGIESTPEPFSGFGLATAIPKGERLSILLQMSTQLGLEVWQPIICEDSAIRTLDVESARLRRILIEGCKVSRRPWAMRMNPPLRLEEAIERCDPGKPLYFGDREGGEPGFDAQPGWVFIGPEAGFSESERESLRRRGATPLSFGEYNLRIETAAVAAVSVFNVTIRQGQGQRR
jgi:16S rRNA (uracil1498-N3)-methyltransferase